MALGALGHLMAFAGVSAAHSPDQNLEKQLMALERSSWAAWQKMDVSFWEDFLSEDHIELNAFVGPVGKAAVIGGIAKKACQVRSYKVDRFTFQRLDENTAILVYRADQDTSCGSVTVPTPNWATSIYQRRNGKWKNVLFELTPIAQPPKASQRETP